jgi:hypothetical protein
MGNSAGPKITKDGLVLDFDAANPKSYNFYADSYASNVSLYLQMNGANGSTTFTDSSPNALAVTAVGNAQISTTQSKYNGTSAYFDGTGDYLSIAANSAIDLGSGDFTIEFWVRPAAKTNAVDAVFGYGNYACMFYHNGTNWTLEMSSTGSSNQLVITCAVTLNTWQHIAIVRNGSSIVVYKDGVSSATGTFTGTVTTNARTLRIGDNGNSQNINGYIDELTITKGVARYTSAFTSPPIPSTCTDLTRSKNVGTLTGGVDYNFSNGGSLVFDGTNDYITSPTSTLFNFGTGDFTIEMWVYPTSVKTFSLLDFRINETNPNGNAFVIGTSASNFWVVYQNGNQITGPTVVANQWVQLVVNRVGTAVKMFLNGVQAGSTWTTSNTFTDGAFVLGTDYPLNARFFQGNVSSVKIYKAKGLTSTEVYNNFVANRGRFGV